ncbi:hypothetical protein D915_008500 [Fasciola hepatica]|uniref:V-type proton ATPase subunit S1/VOA1 transmembrane domain-containing protein n=1 Tax=Fasciola hepatica TaxID=6192 RepID=A0A4E0RXQ8_FASHE|nr:hypothetical protein D915_008500 [Fasciola hepatica]
MIYFKGFISHLCLVSAVCFFSCCVSNGALFDNVTFVNDTSCMFFFGRIHLINTDNKGMITLPVKPSSSPKVVCRVDESTLQLKYSSVDEIQSLDLRLVFSLAVCSFVQYPILFVSLSLSRDSRNWQFSSANISVVCSGTSKTCVNVADGQLQLNWLTAPSNMSYKCTNTPVSTIITSDAKSIPLAVRFYWLQFQPFDVSGGRFNEAVDCTSLFTIPIWSVLLVSFLLIGILSYGLVMLSAVQPNALYDDPKAKMVQLGGNN